AGLSVAAGATAKVAHRPGPTGAHSALAAMPARRADRRLLLLLRAARVWQPRRGHAGGPVVRALPVLDSEYRRDQRWRACHLSAGRLPGAGRAGRSGRCTVVEPPLRARPGWIGARSRRLLALRYRRVALVPVALPVERSGLAVCRAGLPWVYHRPGALGVSQLEDLQRYRSHSGFGLPQFMGR